MTFVFALMTRSVSSRKRISTYLFSWPAIGFFKEYDMRPSSSISMGMVVAIFSLASFTLALRFQSLRMPGFGCNSPEDCSSGLKFTNSSLENISFHWWVEECSHTSIDPPVNHTEIWSFACGLEIAYPRVVMMPSILESIIWFGELKSRHGLPGSIAKAVTVL